MYSPTVQPSDDRVESHRHGRTRHGVLKHTLRDNHHAAAHDKDRRNTALPTELRPRQAYQWSRRDSNPRHVVPAAFVPTTIIQTVATRCWRNNFRCSVLSYRFPGPGLSPGDLRSQCSSSGIRRNIQGVTTSSCHVLRRHSPAVPLTRTKTANRLLTHPNSSRILIIVSYSVFNLTPAAAKHALPVTLAVSHSRPTLLPDTANTAVSWGSIWGRLGDDSGSFGGRFGVVWGTVWGRFGIAFSAPPGSYENHNLLCNNYLLLMCRKIPRPNLTLFQSHKLRRQGGGNNSDALW